MEQMMLLSDEDAAAGLPKVTLWTDGSCIKNPGGAGGWAFVLQDESGRIVHEASGHVPAPTTNNRAEWMAIIAGLKSLANRTRVVIKADSNICVYAINGWGKASHKRGNQDLVREALELCRSHIVTAEWVKAHSGIKENERCDKLAAAANKCEIIEKSY